MPQLAPTAGSVNLGRFIKFLINSRNGCKIYDGSKAAAFPQVGNQNDRTEAVFIRQNIGYRPFQAKTAHQGPVVGHGAWNDPDMMVVGLKGEGYVGQIGGGCTVNEYSAHFSLWCMLSAPLLLGHDVRKDMPEIDEIVLNRELIAINQDDLGVQAYALPPMSNGDIVLAKPLYGGDIAFCLLNETDAAKLMILSWDYCGWEMTDTIHLRDVIAHRDLGNFLHGAHFDVPAHSAIVLRAHRV